MPQINVEFDEPTMRSIDRLASKLSIKRTDLFRRLAGEAIAADAEGRELFVPSLREVTADQVAHLIREVETLTTELERVTRQNTKLEADLRKALAAYECDAAKAQERGLREAEDALERKVEPLKAELAEHRAETARLVEEHPRLRQLEEGQARLMKALKLQQPPVQFHLGNHKLPVWWPLFALAMLTVFGFGLIIALSAMLPDRWMAVPVADRMLGGRGFCVLVDNRMGEGTCARWVEAERPTGQVPAKGRPTR
jgi:regulator of replication initiation timing